ncbi:tyrosine-protein phosphatase [Pedobacter duraquae]|uniref:protein-tyrosine-phosphatase n=1 Tax=Pedobacter duraquae TaxID=425511 RepID=A0A4R6IAT6_9SPHI|nr:CpsB/CapC family capsule biosynthesis tyrosine phosphatase [Pedobacter duraquae]TDO19012.1 tyrosine-protein phosphatase YwqE [Pedobacter duraquae]
MFSIFKKKPHIDNIEWLGVDLHSHILPGLDDGSPDLDTSLELIRHLRELGFRKFIFTPHIFTELYPNSNETILPALMLIKDALKNKNMDVEVSAAAEYMIDETFKVKEAHLTLPGNHILVEMSYLNETPNIEQIIFDLQIKGYHVILAHPERYKFYHHNIERFHRFKDMGVLFQLNLLSVVGYYGKEEKRISEYLLQKKCYDFASTDLHHDKHLLALSVAIKKGHLYEKIGTYPFKNKQLFS